MAEVRRVPVAASARSRTASYLNTSGIIGAAYAAAAAQRMRRRVACRTRDGAHAHRAQRGRAGGDERRRGASPAGLIAGSVGEAQPVQLHLLDATYELFRAHFGGRRTPTRDGQPVGATLGVVESVLSLFRDDGVTHLGCATDHVIRSWRNDRFAGYKTEAGMPPELLAQFPLVEEALRAIGMVVWPMVEFEADDALGAAAARWADDPAVERVVILSPDKDMAQCVREDGRVVTYDRRKRAFMDADAVRAKFGVSPASIPDYLALVGDSSDGYPGPAGLGRGLHGGGAAPLPASRGHPRLGASAGTSACAAPRRWRPRCGSSAPEAMLYRELATLSLDAPIPQRSQPSCAGRACRASRSRRSPSAWPNRSCGSAFRAGPTESSRPAPTHYSSCDRIDHSVRADAERRTLPLAVGPLPTRMHVHRPLTGERSVVVLGVAVEADAPESPARHAQGSSVTAVAARLTTTTTSSRGPPASQRWNASSLRASSARRMRTWSPRRPCVAPSTFRRRRTRSRCIRRIPSWRCSFDQSRGSASSNQRSSSSS